MLKLPIRRRRCSRFRDDEQAAAAAGFAKRKLGIDLCDIEPWSPKLKPLGGGPDSPKRSVAFDTEKTASRHACPDPIQVPGSTTAMTPRSARSSLQQRRLGLSLKIDCPAPEDKLQIIQASGNSLLDQYDLQEKLGQGTSGFVHRAIRKSDKLQVAVKAMRALDEEIISIRRQEFDILRKLAHPHIVKAVDFFVSNEQAILVLEYFSSHTLEHAMKIAPGRMLSEPTAKSLSNMLLQAVDCLHQHQIVHRDIKEANILVSPDLTQLRLIDFNAARCVLDGEALTMTGSTLYLAPEVLQGTSASESSDVWSVGLCMHVMLTGHLPWQRHGGKSLAAYAKQITRSPLSSESKQWHRLSKTCRAILELCLQVDEELRPAPESLLQHAWFRTDVEGFMLQRSHTDSLEKCSDFKCPATEEASAWLRKSTRSSFFKAATTGRLAQILPGA
eukprot:TRINITY_DN102985_c0_g1_i1.p1 TRINITY_DN102985_c0_g1~~TRINITY_DN102985_c0_g1_i1.p1  ORF type:complete len:445 (-),score=90.48 TRINITY_DN102985_c0_g1_i1:74-1408(-)